MKLGSFVVLVWLVCQSAFAHFELYHRIELRLGSGLNRIEVLIHQSDLEGSTIDDYLRDNFVIRLDGEVLETEPEVDRSSLDLPDGFLSAGFELGKVTLLELRLMPDSGKRLLFVITRPGTFPATRDLAPGDELELVLR